MLYRIEAGLFPHLDDTIGRKTAASIREALGIPVKSVRTIKVFIFQYGLHIIEVKVDETMYGNDFISAEMVRT